MNEATPTTRHTFIVRLWSETDHPTPAQWRGSVEHVPTGERMYFTRLTDLTDWLAFHLRETPPPSPQREP
ncbi:MAG: hypothetical protein KKA73_13755 [Chloroflexi bacterium]|nr:hypothetical protein [Chloroflexota bacterium]MBU1748748.1 hypothetical protein [Chloroflexota bacterium]MBU1879110.1 hypothetical protein [Chloroflexota bacterium]